MARNFTEELQALKVDASEQNKGAYPQIVFYEWNEWIQFREYVSDYMPIPRRLKQPIQFMGILVKPALK